MIMIIIYYCYLHKVSLKKVAGTANMACKPYYYYHYHYHYHYHYYYYYHYHYYYHYYYYSEASVGVIVWCMPPEHAPGCR